MKRLAFVLGVTLLGLPAQADITHRIQSSIQLSVDGAGSVATRIPLHTLYLVQTSLWTLLVVLAPLLPVPLLVTLLLLTALQLLATLLAIQNRSLRETQRPQTPPSRRE